MANGDPITEVKISEDFHKQINELMIDNEKMRVVLYELMVCYNRDKHLLNFNVDLVRKALQNT